MTRRAPADPPPDVACVTCRVGIAQTSLAMLETVTRALVARYGSQVTP